MTPVDDYWNVLPLFILFREAIEAAIIVSVLLQFLNRAAPHLKKYVWWGVAGGVGCSIVIGTIFIIVYYVAQNNLFQGKNQLIFKGSVSVVASCMIGLLGFAMLRFMGWEEKWKRKLAAKAKLAGIDVNDDPTKADALDEESPKLPSASSDTPKAPQPSPSLWSTFTRKLKAKLTRSKQDQDQLSTGSTEGHEAHVVPALGVAPPEDVPVDNEGWSLFLATFSTVVREGLESMVFLAGVGNVNPTAIPLPGFVGLFCGILVGFFLYYTGRTVKDVKVLLVGFSIVLFFIAAGQMELGGNYLMRADTFGTYYNGPLTAPAPEGAAAAAFGDGDEVYDAGGTDDGYAAPNPQPWWQRPLWDISNCCPDTDEGNKFFSLMKAIFGYNAKPTFVDFVFYTGFWVLVLSLMLVKLHRGRLFDADYKYKLEMKKKAEEEAAIAAAKGLAPADASSECEEAGGRSSEEEAAKRT